MNSAAPKPSSQHMGRGYFSMKRALTIFTLLFVTEIAIAVFHFHKFIRGFVGDVLVIPLLYFLIRLFVRWKTLHLVLITLGIGCSVELLQYLNAFEFISKHSSVLKIALGTTADWKDILAYSIGAALIVLIEKNTMYGKD